VVCALCGGGFPRGSSFAARFIGWGANGPDHPEVLKGRTEACQRPDPDRGGASIPQPDPSIPQGERVWASIPQPERETVRPGRPKDQYEMWVLERIAPGVGLGANAHSRVAPGYEASLCAKGGSSLA